MQTVTNKTTRIDIKYLDGMNANVGSNVARISEPELIINGRSKLIGTIDKRGGTRRLGSDMSAATGNYGIAYFKNSGSNNHGMYRVSTVSGVTTIYYLKSDGTWTALTGNGTNLSAADCSFTVAEDNLYVVNYSDVNRYVAESDGTTVTTSATATGNLYGSPKANLITYYQNKLYVADYLNGSKREKQGVMMSSTPLGLICLVDGDVAAADCGADDWINVTSTKFLYATDTIDIYRGGTKIADVTIKAKTETSFQINAISFSSGNSLSSADEIWVDGSYSGTRVFRWATNPTSGDVDAKKYDTFKISSSNDTSEIKLMTPINGVMVLANNNNVSFWNGYNLANLDGEIGCPSKQGWVKAGGLLWFVHYTGIYVTDGKSIPRLISQKIQPIFDNASVSGIEAAAAGKKGNSILFAIGNITIYNPDNSEKLSLTNVLVEYNYKQNNFFIHTGISAKSFCTYRATDGIDRLEFMPSTGDIKELFYGTADDTTTEIIFRVDFPQITLSKEFENVVYPKQVIIENDIGSDGKVFLSYDGGRYYEAPTSVNKGCTVINIEPTSEDAGQPRCRTLGISIREYSTRSFKVSKLAIIYNMTEESEEHRNLYTYGK